MNRAIRIALGTGTIISGAAALSIGAAFNAQQQEQALSRAQYAAALAQIEAARPQALSRCDRTAGIDRDVCRAQAEANDMVRVAEVEASFRRDRDSARAAQRARIEARYVVERAKCAAWGGFQRDRCQISAHAARGRALLEMAAPYEVRS